VNNGLYGRQLKEVLPEENIQRSFSYQVFSFIFSSHHGFYSMDEKASPRLALLHHFPLPLHTPPLFSPSFLYPLAFSRLISLIRLISILLSDYTLFYYITTVLSFPMIYDLYNLFYSFLFFFILFYSFLFFFILFYSFLFFFILFYSFLFFSILFYSFLFFSILFYSFLFFSILFYSFLFFSFFFILLFYY
jgi:hypothetical protein